MTYLSDRINMDSYGQTKDIFTPKEWSNYHENKYSASHGERVHSERVKNDSRDIIQDTHATTQRYQQESTKRLRERLHDINFWKQELERQIYDIDCETSRLVKEKHRMELALQQTDYPLQIVTENINVRGHRRGVDKVEDGVQEALKLYKRAVGVGDNHC
ncbi:hypothetical protein CRM22_000210 [Opisthorchis felineus]|uniref:Tektin n=1 Tax=Opisthorchis felineus TaxID=147828 RepID=A0A4S2MGA9_OPIFE|nr:hypothetical protein CRM22_000210 [Opisthorchis felineus]